MARRHTDEEVRHGAGAGMAALLGGVICFASAGADNMRGALIGAGVMIVAALIGAGGPGGDNE